MSTTMLTLLLAVGFLGIGLIFFTLRIYLVKNGEVRGGCASKNPLLQKEGAVCGVCGQVPVGECANPEKSNS